jgi:tetratricopeptide (TPR) repeat protein
MDFLYDFALMAEKMGNRGDGKIAAPGDRQAPDNHHAYNALGYSLADRNVRLKEAYQLIDKAQKMAPGDPFIMDSMGWVQYRLGKLDAAEAQLRKAYAAAQRSGDRRPPGRSAVEEGPAGRCPQAVARSAGQGSEERCAESTLARLRSFAVK